MSGSSFGACALHVAPESFIGGPLALVQTGDRIENRRRCAPPRQLAAARGALYVQHVLQVDAGCDFDVMVRPRATAKPDID